MEGMYEREHTLGVSVWHEHVACESGVLSSSHIWNPPAESSLGDSGFKNTTWQALFRGIQAATPQLQPETRKTSRYV